MSMIDGAINPNVTIENQAPTADQILNSLPRPKVWCVYDRDGKLIARLSNPDEAADYNTRMPGQFTVKEEDNPQFAPPEPSPVPPKRTKKKASK